MYKHLLLILLSTIGLTSCSSRFLRSDRPNWKTPLQYEVDLLDRADDLFKVKLNVNNLGADSIYQFASTAPGTYQIMDVGRFVRSFSAHDANGNAIATNQVSTNQWQISAPEKVAEIYYTIAETFDTPVDSNRIFLMAGTSIEEDHTQFMAHAVLGFPSGMQNRPLTIDFKYPKEWMIGSALRQKDGVYYADTYDHAVDSPVLLGRLSKADLKVNGTSIEIFTYSKTDKIQSEDILEVINDVLLASDKFLNGLPVDIYTFLFFLEDVTLGAWEHSYSSNYIYREMSKEELTAFGLPDVIAHEFFHIITPLNIHSEIIEEFNFVNPVLSEHLWLYEGVTEWAAQALQLKAGLIEPQTYFRKMSQKLQTSAHFNSEFSLKDLALKAFTPDGKRQYPNIYMKGAITAGLLDIRLLELSSGKQGLREILNKLAHKYGSKKPFSEKGFYDVFVEMTHPEIAPFFEDYIRNAQSLPIAEYYEKIGVAYSPKQETDEMTTVGGFQITVSSDSQFLIQGVVEEVQKFGLRDGDVLHKYEGEVITMKNIRELFGKFKAVKAGTPYKLGVLRNGEELELTCEKIEIRKVELHQFELIENPTAAQLKLRKAWQRNS